MTRNPYAARLNSFKVNAASFWPGKNRGPTTIDLLQRAATVDGLTAVDFNYPDHLEGLNETDLRASFEDLGLTLNGFAMRYYGNPAYSIGAFTNPDPAVRQEAIELTKRGIDALDRMGGTLMTVWLGQDGFDYSFQADYGWLWERTIVALQDVAGHHPGINISVEYKPNEPRCFSVLPDVATTLLALRDVNRANMGVTLDFAHVLYADEMPAYAASLIARQSRLLGVHLNDGYGKRDDGLMAGSVHPLQTIELLTVLARLDYRGAIYFDTFPDITGLDPVAECKTNISAVAAMKRVAERLQHNEQLAQATGAQDAIAAQRIVQAALYGSK
jgi:sugar phosphate isomerase/epimerase